MNSTLLLNRGKVYSLCRQRLICRKLDVVKKEKVVVYPPTRLRVGGFGLGLSCRFFFEAEPSLRAEHQALLQLSHGSQWQPLLSSPYGDPRSIVLFQRPKPQPQLRPAAGCRL